MSDQWPTDGTRPYGMSGSILSLNPTDRRVKAASTMTPAELRKPRVIRNWPEPLPDVPGGGPAPPTEVPMVTGVVVSAGLDSVTVSATNLEATSLLWLRELGAPEWDGPPATVTLPDSIAASYTFVAGGVYEVVVENSVGESEAYEHLVPV